MGRFLSVFVLPALLMTAALENWSLISMTYLLAFLYIQYNAPRNGFQLRRQLLVLRFLLVFSSLIIFSEAIFQLLLIIGGSQWSVAETKWAKLIGLLRVHSLRFPSSVYVLMIQALIAFVSLIELYESRFQITSWKDSSWGYLYLSVVNLGLHPRAFCCLCLPAVQLIVGIGFPSWISLPYFICSSIGLVDWSLTSNFIGLFRCWRYLLFYAGLNILLLYVYQLPLEYSVTGFWIANFIGLCKISPKSGWPEICSGVFLVLFYLMLSWIQNDLEEMDFIMSKKGSNLTEQLIPRNNIFILWESRSGANHTNVLFQESVFETFSINFFTYGFPISLLALSFWSFHFRSFCAFGLLAYVGYILYAFPSMYRLHRLNGSLLIFILFWAASTYVFNVAYTFFNKKLLKDMRIWETIGLWHYPVPGFYLLAQYGLGVLVAIGNLVNNYVFLYLSNEDHHQRNQDSTIEDKEETKILIVATIAWGLHKSSRAIVLALIFINAMNSGLIHAAYMIFFVIFLLRHNVGRKLQQYLILLCEVHFALLYIIRLDLVCKALDEKGSIFIEVLSQLGLLHQPGSSDFSKIVVLASFCAINNHGSEMLFSMSAILQNNPPIGFSILRAGLIRSVLVSVCTLGHGEYSENNSFHGMEQIQIQNFGQITLPLFLLISHLIAYQYLFAEETLHPRDDHHELVQLKISSYLRATGQKFLSAYRSCGTYIALLTILLTVYQVRPNYVSFGYLFLVLFWMIGRQLMGKTRRHLWLPLKLYAVSMFILSYSMSVFPFFQSWLSKLVDLDSAFGYDREASELINILESLAIIVVMQLHSYERRQNNDVLVKSADQEIGAHSFTKQMLLWHIEKILLIATFYASLSSIGMFGFLYLLILVFCSTQAKASRILSKILIVYSGFLVMLEYLFQLRGDKVEMFPGQKYYYLSLLLGLHLYKHGFLGIEAGLRGKILVIVACIIQYNVNCWSEMISCEDSAEACDQPCGLSGSTKEATKTSINVKKKMSTSIDSSHLLKKQVGESQAWSLTDSSLSQGQGLIFSEGNNRRKYFYNYFWESARESNKWNRKRIIFLRKERLDMQKRTLQIYMKFLVENMFALFGLEINMIALLLASFSVLNSISMLYVGSLAACILLPRHLLRKVWPLFLFIFASVLTFEYLAIWSNLISSKQKSSSEAEVACHDCWRISDSHFNFCKNCWLGIIVDDTRMLVSYFAVFMTACLKLRADHNSILLSSQTYQELIFQYKNASVLGDLSFETKGFWTILDYLRLQCYCNLLNLVLMLILITGTLEYDILHLGYLGFALIFFRMRLEIIKNKKKIFKYLRMYNLILIVLSLAYQSPFIGQSNDGKCETKDYVLEVIGFYKYDYGFRITSRSAVVETVIFMLVSLQSYMFSTQEYDYVSKYLEAEQIGAIGRQQEKRAAWKTAELQHIRESEEQKRLRNLQVEKIKSEMHNHQVQLQNLSPEHGGTTGLEREGIRRRKTTFLDSYRADVIAGNERNDIKRKSLNSSSNIISTIDLNDTLLNKGIGANSGPESTKHSRESLHELTKMREYGSYDELVDRGKANKTKLRVKENLIISALHLIGDGFFHVKSLGHLAVNNLIDLLNIEHEEEDSSGYTSDDDIYYEIENQNTVYEHSDHVSPIQSGCDQTTSEAAYQQIGVIIRHIWLRMLSNNEIVCYSCFVLIFLWNFSLLSMVYLAALFLYALCAHTGPSYMFWVIMLMYTELCILLQYLFQIIIQHCGQTIHMSFLVELGFPDNRIKTSFVMSNLPLFLVYLFTLLQTSLTTGEDEWGTVTFKSHKQPNQCEEDVKRCYCEKTRIAIIFPLRSAIVLLSKRLLRYWKSLTEGVETPPYYFQISMEINSWPEDGVQPSRIESGINKLLEVLYDRVWKKNNPNHIDLASKVRVQSIEQSSEKASTALAVFEVLYASSAAKCSSLDWYSSLTPAADVANEIRQAESVGIHEEIGFPYPIISVIGGGKRQIDLYAYIFCADLSVFFLVAIFYQSIMKNNSEFLEVYQLEDQFPKEFVFILMVLFFLIVLDRIIYLCSFATGKVIFYLFNLILFTYSVTKYAWCMEPSHKTSGKLAIRAIYLTKAASLALQAIQMRFGLPHKSTLYRQFLTSIVSKINFLGFRIYRALPFLYELRCVLDWSCTTTSLTMYDWLKLEDIHSSLFLVQCDVDLNRASHKKGEKQTKMTKFCNGICLFFVLICVIWAPMLMYSSGNPTNIANPIKDASIRIDIKTVSGRLLLYETTLCEKISWDELHQATVLDPYDYLSAYNDYDIQLICCQSDASTSWDVPPVVQDRFMKSLTQSMDITFYWKFMRDRPKGKEVVNYELILQNEDLPDSSEVIQVLNGTINNFTIQNVYPRYFRLTGSGDVRSLEQMVDLVSGHLVLNRGNPEWWSFYDSGLVASGCGELTGPMAVIISEETPQGIIGETLSKFSIWGLYITFVLAVGRFIRLQCSDLRMRIPFENLPSCDRLLAICEDIYAARAEGELEVEENLYWTLVKIYRSPHMLLEYTKPN